VNGVCFSGFNKPAHHKPVVFVLFFSFFFFCPSTGI